MKQTKSLSISGTVAGSYSFLRGALVPALTGSILYAITSLIGDYIREHDVFGLYSFFASFSLLGSVGTVWLAMALREGLGKARKGLYGLHIGREELWLSLSLAGFAFVIGLIAFLVGFFVFLFVMCVAVIGGGGLSGADVANAPIYESAEAFRAFLSSTGSGQVVSVIGALTLAGAVGFMTWLVLRLLPFAAGAVDQKRFVVLQAMAWTRYQDKALFGAGIMTVGVGLFIIFAGRFALGMLPFPFLAIEIVKHLLSCFGVLLIVGYICEVYRGTVLAACTDLTNLES